MVLDRIRRWWHCDSCAGSRLGHYFPCPASVNYTATDPRITGRAATDREDLRDETPVGG